VFLLLLCLSSVAFAWEPSADNSFWQHGLNYQLQLHDSIWIAYEVVDEWMYVGVAAHTVGWIGFGPSETGTMIGASICVVIEQNPGNVTAVEYYTTAMTQPYLAETNNCELLEYASYGSTNESYAYFRRPTRGCKTEGNNGLDIIREWDTKFIAAFGTSLEYFSYHGIYSKTTIRINPYYGPTPLPDLPDDAIVFDAFVEQRPTGNDRNLYYCRGFTFPDDKRYHVIRFDAIYNEEEVLPAFHHHLILYSCTSGELPASYANGENRDCSVAPPAGCPTFFIGWALGQQAIDTRPAGYAIGAGDAPVHKAVVAQAHVDHPTEEAGINLPAWGMRLWYTPTLQEFEGVTFGHYITYNGGLPPGEPRWEMRGELAKELLAAHIPDGGLVIQVISAHAHGLQSKWKWWIIRDGIERPDLGYVQNSWDYNTQDGIPRNPHHELRIFPGDRFIYSCIYDTTNRTGRTYWGEGFEDEMCILYMNVYPNFKNSMTTCFVDGRNPEDIRDDNDVMFTACLGTIPPYSGPTFWNETWTLPPAPPSVCSTDSTFAHTIDHPLSSD